MIDSRQQAVSSVSPVPDTVTPSNASNSIVNLPEAVTDESMHKETSSAEIDWTKPPNPDDYPQSIYWALRNAFSLPNFQELSVSEELEKRTERFFFENQKVVEQAWIDSDWSGSRVVLMDITGDHNPEVLIQYFQSDTVNNITSGVVDVYDLATAQCIGELWANDPWCENMGWYMSSSKEDISFFVMDYIFFRTSDESGLSTELHHDAYILWEIDYNETRLDANPLWLLMDTIWFNPRDEEITEYSLIEPSYELATNFSKDPYSWYDTIMGMANEGCDPIIRDAVLRLQPIETAHKKYAYIDQEGLHLRDAA